MSLSEFIAATQEEMKSRIEEECKKQMMSLLEASFSSKWEEYTSKTVEAASATTLYTKQYGKLDITKDYNDVHGFPHYTILHQQIDKIKFSSKKVYFIHCQAYLSTQSPSDHAVNAVLIDNYGFYHQICAYINGRYCHPPSETIIDVQKPVANIPAAGCEINTYLYPLPNMLIDIIKAEPVTGSDGSINYLVKNLPEIRKAAALFHEQATATEKLLIQKKIYEATLAENEALKARLAGVEARLRAIEASSPTEDLLGLEGGCTAETEPSRA